MRIPKFDNEADEAQWLYENRESLAAEFLRSAPKGRVQHKKEQLRPCLEAELLEGLQTKQIAISPDDLKRRSLVSVLRSKLGRP
jgi:hypothetical protein